MISIKAKNLSDAWEKSFIELYKHGKENEEMLRDETTTIEIENPTEKRFNEKFPLKTGTIKEYNNYIIKGGNQGNVKNEHALYHNRLFKHFNNQLEYVEKKLKEEPLSKKAQISFWDPNIDQLKDKVPCIQIMWFRIVNGKLEMHVHMRGNSAYNKLLMNLNISTEIMEYLAKKLNVDIGRYIHFVDSFHIYKENKNNVEILYKKLISK